MTREERAFNRLHRPRKSKPAPQKVEWPRRIMEVTPPGKAPSCIVWEQRHGVWFWIHKDPALNWLNLELWGDTEHAFARVCRRFSLSWKWR